MNVGGGALSVYRSAHLVDFVDKELQLVDRLDVDGRRHRDAATAE